MWHVTLKLEFALKSFDTCTWLNFNDKHFWFPITCNTLCCFYLRSLFVTNPECHRLMFSKSVMIPVNVLSHSSQSISSGTVHDRSSCVRNKLSNGFDDSQPCYPLQGFVSFFSIFSFALTCFKLVESIIEYSMSITS